MGVEENDLKRKVASYSDFSLSSIVVKLSEILSQTFIWVNPFSLLGIEILWEDSRELCHFLIGRTYLY